MSQTMAESTGASDQRYKTDACIGRAGILLPAIVRDMSHGLNRSFGNKKEMIIGPN